STPFTDLQEKYKNNINFKRNVNMAIEITVLDINPDTASLIANRIVAIADEVMNEIRSKRNTQAYQIVKKIYLGKMDQIKDMEDSIQFIMLNGVIDVSGQAEAYSDAHANALAKGNHKGALAIEKKLNTISKYGAQFISLNENLIVEQKMLSELKAKFTEAQVDLEEKLENVFIVANAFPAEKNSYPIKWLIVLLSTAGGLIMGILAIIVYEQLQKLKFEIEKQTIE
ncbi:MAG: capsular polysaccharide biosynthesis protein, partial [Saprospiraceae bacterium]